MAIRGLLQISREKIRVCGGCEFLRKPLMQCSQCGCFVRIKSMVPKGECPKGKWKEINNKK